MCNGGQLFNKSVAALALLSHARFIRIGSTVQAHQNSPNIEKSVPKLFSKMFLYPNYYFWPISNPRMIYKIVSEWSNIVKMKM